MVHHTYINSDNDEANDDVSKTAMVKTAEGDDAMSSPWSLDKLVWISALLELCDLYNGDNDDKNDGRYNYADDNNDEDSNDIVDNGGGDDNFLTYFFHRWTMSCLYGSLF